MNSLNLKASVSFVGDGSTNKFYFGFDYINKQFVKVQIGNEGQSLTYPSDYTVDDRSVVLKDTPAVGVAIRVYRETSSDRIVEWADGAFIKASQMTLENLQQLHLIEEAQDYPILNSLSKYPDGVNFNALGSRVINVSDPKDPQDAVTKNYMETVQGGFVTAYTILVQDARVSEQNAAESARVATENAMDFNMLKRNKTYSIGDIAYSSYLPSWARLECVTAGTTADTVPSSITTVSSGGVLISDGTVTWIVDDVRDMTPVGCVRGSLFLPKGYIKANGATVQRADYPRLVQFIESNNLWTDDTTTNAGLFGKGDGSSTFVLPDYRERMMQYTEWNIGMRRGAGLPNITGQIGKIWGGVWTLPTDTGYKGAIQPGELVDNQGIPLTNSTNGKVAAHDNFNASWSNSIYGSSDTVQPPAINVIPILRY